MKLNVNDIGSAPEEMLDGKGVSFCHGLVTKLPIFSRLCR